MALYEERATRRGDEDEDPYTHLVLMVDEPPAVGFLPYGEPWTRRAPRFDDFGLGARFGTDPLEEV